MIHYRNMASWLNVTLQLDLPGLPAIVEDQLVDLIERKDPAVVGKQD